MLSKTSLIKGGDTVYLRAGTYPEPIHASFVWKHNGASGNPITLRPYRDERAIIDGGLQVLGSWITIRDLEILNSIPQRITLEAGSFPSGIAQTIGIDVFGQGVKVINNIVHDTSNGLGSWKNATGTEFYGNIVFYSGWKGPDRGHGHGVYAQNQFGEQHITDNIIFHQFGQGMQVYGSSNTFLNNFRLEGNIVFNNGSLAKNLSRNILVGGTVIANNPVLKNNYSYYPTTRNHGGDNNIGYYTAGYGCSNAVIEGNYFVSGGIGLSYWKCAATSFKENTIIGETRGFTASAYPGNTFQPVTSRPVAQKIVVRPNRYEAGRAHIAVFNWPKQSYADVDISTAGLSLGDAFEIHDVQNIFGAPVASGTYSGNPVRIPLNLIAMTNPIGIAPPAHTDIEFNAFLLRRLGGEESTGVKPLQVSGVSVSDITKNSAVIKWTTNLAANAQVEYGMTTAMGSATSVTAGGSKNHSLFLNGLTAGATIFYRVRSVTPDGEVSQLGGLQFVTLVQPPDPAPTPDPKPTPTPTPDPSPIPTSAPANAYLSYLEAEDQSRNAPTGMYLPAADRFVIVSSPAASRGKYLSSPVAGKSYVTFSVVAPVAGTYAMWLRVLATPASTGGVFISVNGGPEQLFNAANGSWSTQWQWTKAQVLTLPRGTHRITMRARDVQFALDRLLLADSTSFVPEI
ncbi:MAG TPA: hypothetical protein VEX68_12710 [Bryobacteraceae bacterium]|nr:hypothetical protein [Bryobacteraceae bacterium]